MGVPEDLQQNPTEEKVQTRRITNKPKKFHDYLMFTFQEAQAEGEMDGRLFGKQSYLEIC